MTLPRKKRIRNEFRIDESRNIVDPSPHYFEFTAFPKIQFVTYGINDELSGLDFDHVDLGFRLDGVLYVARIRRYEATIEGVFGGYYVVFEVMRIEDGARMYPRHLSRTINDNDYSESREHYIHMLRQMQGMLEEFESMG